MSNNNHKNSVCDANESLIAYLYGEVGAAEKAAFETHLKICAACHDELTEFGFARSAVNEWRVEEFDVLSTPIFEISRHAVTNQTAATDSRSWFLRLSQIFSFRPALAMSAFAVLIALFGTAWLISSSKGGDQIAEKINDRDALKIIASPTVEKSIEPSKDNNDNDNNDNNDKNVSELPSSPKESPVKTTAKKSDVQRNSALKAATNAPKSAAGDDVPVKVVKTNRGNLKPPADLEAKVPRLSDVEVEEEDSVRLADLFDEIGTR